MHRQWPQRSVEFNLSSCTTRHQGNPYGTMSRQGFACNECMQCMQCIDQQLLLEPFVKSEDKSPCSKAISPWPHDNRRLAQFCLCSPRTYCTRERQPRQCLYTDSHHTCTQVRLRHRCTPVDL